MHKKLLILNLLLLASCSLWAQNVVSLDECRRRALEANLSLKQADVKREETAALEKVALWQMLPKVSANGGYMWMLRSVNLLSEEQKERLGNLGQTVQGDISQALHEELGDLPIGGNRLADRLSDVIGNSRFIESLNNVGNDLVQDLETDTRNMGGVLLTVSQPIYVGGKLMAAYRTAQLLNDLNGVQYDKEREATLIAVDEAYWQVVSVQHKERLARQYAALLDTLEANVQMAVEAEMATRGDLARVRVKRNEAQMTLTRAVNGLALSRMLLAQRCGMPLDTVFEVADNDIVLHANPFLPAIDMNSVYSNRAEMKMLRISEGIADQGVRMAAGSLKPNVAMTAGYLLTNPNVFDGFSNSWGGTPMAGVVVNIPLVHPGGVYALRAAKAKKKEAAFKRQEAEEMIELQVNKLRYELELAYKKQLQAESNVEQAEENLRLADESFKAGMCSSSDLMAAQTAWMQAKGEVIDAGIEIAVSRLYLHQAMGY